MSRTLLMLLPTLLCMAACKTESTAPVSPNGSRVAAMENNANARTVGIGTGDLNVDGKALGIKPGEVVTIAPGRYSSLTFSNLTGKPNQLITLVAKDLVEVVGGALTLQNVSFLTLDGDSDAKNLLIRDNPYRGIILTGTIPHGLTLQGIRARNIADYSLFYDNRTNYNGSDATACTDFKLLYSDFENTGTIQMRGDLYRSGGLINTGFMKNPEVAYCSFRNSPTAGSLLYIGNGENMNIHHNVVNNVNSQNNDHNGIFFLKGNGNVHHNKCTNHQGNFVRFWPFSQGIAPKDVLLHDNIVWNSRKYSALELQSFADNMVPGVSTYCNAKVYNNTAGRMNTTLPTEYVGVVVDVYNLFGGNLQIFNNLSFDQVKTSANDGVWSQQSVTKPSLYKNNMNLSTASIAGLVDQVGFRLRGNSPAKAAGLYRNFEIDDFYGDRRTTTPSVGAVE